jgi:MoaA/NifB/PqqE/SkfB family radical SAM enzyme
VTNAAIGRSADSPKIRTVTNPITGLREKKYPVMIDEASGHAFSDPQIVSLEISSKCNLHCIMCGFHSIHKKDPQPGQHISKELFRRAIPFIEKAELVPLCGGGEPLLNFRLPKMVRKITDIGVSTAITTNGILLNADRIKEVVDAGLTYIEISVDGTSSFEKIRGVPFEKLENNLKRLAGYKKKNKKRTPIIDLSYTAMRDTLVELDDIVKFGAEIGAREIRVQPLQICFTELIDQNIYHDRERTIRYLKKAKEKAESLDVKLIVRRLSFLNDERYGDDKEFNQYLKKYNCLEPFNSITILADGRIQVCCAGITLTKSLNDHCPEEMWNSDEIKRLRLELIKGEFRQRCKSCNLIHGSPENQVIMQDKVTLLGLLRMERKALLLYREHLKKKGLVKGNLDALKRLYGDLAGGMK